MKSELQIIYTSIIYKTFVLYQIPLSIANAVNNTQIKFLSQDTSSK